MFRHRHRPLTTLTQWKRPVEFPQEFEEASKSRESLALANTTVIVPQTRDNIN